MDSIPWDEHLNQTNHHVRANIFATFFQALKMQIQVNHVFLDQQENMFPKAKGKFQDTINSILTL